jgi:hypothetical protein
MTGTVLAGEGRPTHPKYNRGEINSEWRARAMNVGISLMQITGEKFMDLEKGMVNIQVTTNINILKMVQTEGMLDFNFVFTVNYNPAIASLNIKGSAKVTGDPKELGEIKKSFDEKKNLPPMILQTISNVGFLEGVIISRSLNIPPPIPLPNVMAQQQQVKDSKINPSYIG